MTRSNGLKGEMSLPKIVEAAVPTAVHIVLLLVK